MIHSQTKKYFFINFECLLRFSFISTFSIETTKSIVQIRTTDCNNYVTDFYVIISHFYEHAGTWVEIANYYFRYFYN